MLAALATSMSLAIGYAAHCSFGASLVLAALPSAMRDAIGRPTARCLVAAFAITVLEFAASFIHSRENCDATFFQLGNMRRLARLV